MHNSNETCIETESKILECLDKKTDQHFVFYSTKLVRYVIYNKMPAVYQPTGIFLQISGVLLHPCFFLQMVLLVRQGPVSHRTVEQRGARTEHTK